MHPDKFNFESIPDHALEEESINRMVRVSGNTVCEICGKPYWKHDIEKRIKDMNGYTFLRQLCNGKYGKL